MKIKKLVECVCPDCGIIHVMLIVVDYRIRPDTWHRSGYMVRMCNTELCDIKLKGSISKHLRENSRYNAI